MEFCHNKYDCHIPNNCNKVFSSKILTGLRYLLARLMVYSSILKVFYKIYFSKTKVTHFSLFVQIIFI